MKEDERKNVHESSQIEVVKGQICSTLFLTVNFPINNFFIYLKYIEIRKS